MKKLKVIVWMSVLVLLLPLIQAEAAGNQNIVAVSSAFTEKTGSIPIEVFINSEEKIAGGSLDISYNSEQLRIRDTDVKITDTLSGYLSAGGSDSAGKVSLSFAKATGKALNGTVLELNAYVQSAGAGKNLDLTLQNVELYNEQGQKIDVQLVHGQIKPFAGEEKTYSESVPSNKEWVITLSKPFNPATLNANAVSVTKGTSTVQVTVEAVSATKFKVKPVSAYSRGNYTMYVTEQLRSANGSKLNEPVRFTFSVK